MELREQVQDEIDTLSGIGNDPTGGMTRLLYTESWLKAQEAVKEKMERLGMATRYDAIGNLYGRVEGTKFPNETILSGSHIDTVVNGGTLDGQFGVIGAYLAVASLMERYGRPKRSLEVISMAEEEGSRFPTVFWGSKNLVNEEKREEVENAIDSTGMNFVDAMRERDFNFKKEEERIKREDIKGFVEMHIEQGNVLENNGLQIGVVESIVGLRILTITLKGEANHAGTTPMGYRKDTVYCFSKIVSESIDRAKSEGDPLVLTFGKVTAKPGSLNVVPGETVFTMDCRHTDAETLKRFCEEIVQLMKDIAKDMGIDITIDRMLDEVPVPLDKTIVSTIENVVKQRGVSFKRMHSGAGHDSQIIARHYPTAMIFVPSKKGISHNPAESTNIDDLIEGIETLAGTLYELADL